MSHTVHAYLRPTSHSLTLPHHGSYVVREDKDRYATSLLRLTDAITERLAKAEALTWILQDSREAGQLNSNPRRLQGNGVRAIFLSDNTL